MVASGAPLEQTLARITNLVQEQVFGSRCAIIGSDDEDTVDLVVAPSLPAAWWELAIQERQPESGSAFIPARLLGAPAVVARALGQGTKVNSSRSPSQGGSYTGLPLQVDGNVVGTMALYSHRQPAATALLRDCAQLASVALSRVHSENRVQVQMRVDATTGLPNGHDAKARLEAALQRQQRGFGTFVAVIAVELGRLAEYNATFGRAAGDEILRFVATAATRLCGPTTTVLRVAGGRFLLIVEGEFSVGELVNTAHQVANAAAGPVMVGNQDIIVDAAIGVAIAGEGTSSAVQLLAEAEAATAQARRSRMDRVAVFDPELARQASQRLIVELGLQRALTHDELVVHYQPIHSVADGRLVAAEALLRWQDPETGLRPPADFVPIAEESGLIRQMTRWVLAQACQQIADWQSSTTAPIPISVNVSATELHDPGLVADVREAVTGAGIPPDLLCLELTETAVMDDPDAALEVLASLKAIGVRLAMDDFGTGYSSLAYLQQLPIDYVKIDSGFITAMRRSADDRAIVAAVVDLTTTLGLPTVAEGVENEEQAEALRQMSCRYAQGFHWSPAVPATEFTILLEATAGFAASS